MPEVVTLPPNVVVWLVGVEPPVMVSELNGMVLPTVLPNDTPPVPDVMVRLCTPEAVPSTAAPNVIVPLVLAWLVFRVVSVVLPPKVTAPV